MDFLRAVAVRTFWSLLLFGAAALTLAFQGNNVDWIIVQLVIRLPLLLIVAGVAAAIVHAIAELIGPVITGSRLVGALVAAALAWMLASGPHYFAGLGDDPLLQPAFAGAAALSWLAGAQRRGLLGKTS